MYQKEVTMFYICTCINFPACIFQLFDLFGYVNLRDAVCSPDDLGRYLLFRSEAEARQVSKELCAIDIDRIPDITNTIQKQLDVQSLLKVVRFSKYT